MTDKKNALSDGDISEMFTNIGRAKEDTARGIMEERKKQEDERRNRRQGNVFVGDIAFSDDIDLDALERHIDNELAVARKGIPKEEFDAHREMELDEPVVLPENIPDVEEKDLLGDTSGEEPTVLELADTMSGEVMGNIYADDKDKSSETDVPQPAADVSIDISDEDLVIEIGEDDFCVEANEEEKENPQCPVEYNSFSDISVMENNATGAAVDNSQAESSAASEIQTEETPAAAEKPDEITEFDFSDDVDDAPTDTAPQKSDVSNDGDTAQSEEILDFDFDDEESGAPTNDPAILEDATSADETTTLKASVETEDFVLVEDSTTPEEDAPTEESLEDTDEFVIEDDDILPETTALPEDTPPELKNTLPVDEPLSVAPDFEEIEVKTFVEDAEEKAGGLKINEDMSGTSHVYFGVSKGEGVCGYAVLFESTHGEKIMQSKKISGKSIYQTIFIAAEEMFSMISTYDEKNVVIHSDKKTISVLRQNAIYGIANEYSEECVAYISHVKDITSQRYIRLINDIGAETGAFASSLANYMANK